jgi:hypothetical protein
MLIDAERYDGPFKRHVQYDVIERSDVSQLNALQLHHALTAVYFGQEIHASYVADLWRAHRSTLHMVRSELHLRSDWLLDARPPEGRLYHGFEPQVNYHFGPSFIQCEPIDAEDYEFSHRRPDLVREHEAWLEQTRRSNRRPVAR